MDSFLLIMLIFIGVCILALLFCKYMLWRNDQISKFLIRLIDEDYQTYQLLPDNIYDKMFKNFWVWPLDKFVPSDRVDE